MTEYSGRPLEALGALGELRVAILGIGNDLNGDDAVGVLIARALMDLGRLVGNEDPADRKDPADQGDPGDLLPAAYRQWARAGGRPDVLVIDGGPAPESFTGPLRRFAPQVVILVDAAEIGAAPGEARLFDWQEAAGLSASTHTMPPSMLAKFLMAELGCKVALIGIQFEHLEFEKPLSKPAAAAVARVTDFIRAALAENAS